MDQGEVNENSRCRGITWCHDVERFLLTMRMGIGIVGLFYVELAITYARESQFVSAGVTKRTVR